MNAKESGDVTAKFIDYTRKANRDPIERSFNGTSFLKDIPAMARIYVAWYPESSLAVQRSKDLSVSLRRWQAEPGHPADPPQKKQRRAADK